MTTSSAAASGALCYAQDIGGQVLHVCRVAGYEMPSFVFWASLGILFLFLFASFQLIRQCFALAKSIDGTARALERITRASGPRLTQKELSSLRELMAKSPALAEPWKQFEDTLLPAADTGEIYSTCAVESVFSREAVIGESIQSGFYNAVPGILTGLGLLMTFVAILDGLSHVSVGANMDVTGIGGLINGLSGKFVSSIVAVTCAVAFVFVERIAYSRPQASHRTLHKTLSARFRRRTAEHLLLSIESLLMGSGETRAPRVRDGSSGR